MDKLLKKDKDQLSENNKYWLENLSFGLLEATLGKKSLNKNEIQSVIELIDQTIANLK